MRVEVIEEFLVFGRYMNFSKAASELHISQPNLSKHMIELERELGVALIDRTTFGKNKPVLTMAGKYFFEEVSYVHGSFRSIVERCREIGRLKPRDVRIQELWQNNAMQKLYPLVGSYHDDHPQDEVRFVRLSEENPIEALLDSKFDMVFDVQCGQHADYYDELAERGVRAIKFLEEQPVIWFQKGHKSLAGKTRITSELIATIPVIMTRGKTYDYVVLAFAEYCNRAGMQMSVRSLQLMDNTPTGVYMSNFRDAVLMTTPGMMDDPRLRSRNDLDCIVFDDSRVKLTFNLAVRADDEGSVAFLEYIERQIAE